MPCGMLKKHQTLSVMSLAFGTALFLFACDPTHPTQAESNNPLSQPVRAGRSPLPSQILPISATAKLGNQTFELEVAKTRSQQALGLMYRTFLPSTRGMYTATARSVLDEKLPHILGYDFFAQGKSHCNFAQYPSL
jgi:Uncharacterized ACR, COG1430